MRIAVVIAISLGACVGQKWPAASYPTFQTDRESDAPPPAEPAKPAEPPAPRLIADYVPMNMGIPEPRDVAELVVELHVGDYELPSAPNHVVVRIAETQTVTIHVAPGRVVTAAERSEALQATTSIDADNPTIRSAALAATRHTLGAREQASSLVHWIHAHISFLLQDEPVASAVLDRGTGDCSEMSLLFIAMARSIGLPARRVIGLAANDLDGKPVFAYHAWVEVDIDDRWVQVDPTWDEEVADAAHVTLGEGDSEDWERAAAVMDIFIAGVTWSTSVTQDYAASSLDAIAAAHYKLDSTFARPGCHVDTGNRALFELDSTFTTSAPLRLDVNDDRVFYASPVFLSDGTVFGRIR